MSFIRRYASVLALSIIMTGAAAAQTTAPRQTATVVPSATAEGLRFTAADSAAEMRLEIYAAAGGRVYDSGLRRGSILDVSASEAAQAGLTDGSYLFVVTTLDPNNRVRKSYGTVVVNNGRTEALPIVEEQLKSTQAAVAQSPAQDGAATGDGEKTKAAIVSAHDGQDGQVTSTSGALTFRTGDTYKGEDREQMRVTPEGRVGIGTDRPEATLDVAGTIRARGGIQFEDGTTLTSAAALGARNTAVSIAADGNPTANASGTGTAGRLSKWMDGTGALGDSVITETGGKIGIGTTDPQSALHISGPGGVSAITMDTPGNQKFRFFTVPAIPNWGAFTMNANYNAGWHLDQSTTNGWFFKLDTRGGNADNDSNGLWLWRIPAGANPHTDEYPVFGVTNGRVYFADRVGIGTTTPSATAKLDVAGNLKISGTGNGLVFPDGTVQTTAATGGAGGSMTGTAIVSAVNDAGTVGIIGDNRVSPNLARLNGANAWSGANVFGAGLSANNSLITNVGNPVNAGDAVNKAYADANFVKFVPGAEQLSVGDANGTAPMINLRGGSTCCSGPGGHTPAWFKVFQNGSFVATGNLGIGVSPMQGKGYRTSWDSYKGAFRSGYADNEWDDANVGFFSWAGGSNSTAIGLYALAFGDTNQAESTSSIVFGSGNQVKGAAGFAAGAGNRVCDTYGVAFGNKAISGSPILANGKCDPDTFNIRGLAAIAMGYNVTASQDHTMALGKFASNNGFTGTFIWSDGAAQQTADTFRNTANNEFAARATGGFRFRTNLGGTTGCNLPAGSGVFNCTSSRTTKENFFEVDGNDVLARLRKVPVSTWNYISEGERARHLGPMAEDFHAAFGLGTSDKAIGVQDAVGVSLAAVKALDARTLELQQKTAEVEALRSKVDTLEQRLAALEQLLRAQAGQGQPQQ
jgi:trimeric autotransporter adhesin